VTPHLAGAIDVIVVRQPDGSLRSSPWYVRFGKYSGKFRSPEARRVRVAVNGTAAAFGMHLSRSGEAYFRIEGEEGGEAPPVRPASPSKKGKEEAGGGGGSGAGAGSGDEDDDAAFLSAGYSSLDDGGTSSGGSSIMRPPGWRRLAGLGGSSGALTAAAAGPPPTALGGGGAATPLVGSAPAGGGGLLARWPRPSGGSDAGGSETREPRSPSPPPPPPPAADEGLLGGSLSPEPRAAGAAGAAASGRAGRRGEARSAGAAPPLLELSLCAAAVRAAAASATPGPPHAAVAAAFETGRVDPSALAHPSTGPATLADPDLLVSLGGGSGMWPWHVAAPALAAAAAGVAWRGALEGLVPAAVRGPSDAPLVGDEPAGGEAGVAAGTTTTAAPAKAAAAAPLPPAPPSSSWRDWLPGSGRLSRQGGTPAPGAEGAGAGAGAGPPRPPRPPRPHHRRAFVPSPAQLASLHLTPGRNSLELAVSGRRGGSVLRCSIYALPWHARLIISDVDGTVTKSDVLGHFLPRVGLDWSHGGIARLFRDVADNGYHFMYLSSRSIAQAASTRDFLLSLTQDGGVKMPVGPVIISPDGLIPSLYREMVLRRPHEFKIRALEDVRRLFPAGWNPFHSGFGNRDTDELSYLAVGLPPTRVFIINPKGELRRAAAGSGGGGGGGGGGGEVVGPASLPAINAIVHDVFPPLRVVGAVGGSVDGEWGAAPPPLPPPADGGEGGGAPAADPPPVLLLPPVGREEFSSFSYWRAPPALLDDLLPLGGPGCCDGASATPAAAAAKEAGKAGREANEQVGKED